MIFVVKVFCFERHNAGRNKLAGVSVSVFSKVFALFTLSCLPSETVTDCVMFGAVLQCIQKFFSQTLFDFKKSISGAIELKFSGKTLYAIL